MATPRRAVALAIACAVLSLAAAPARAAFDVTVSSAPTTNGLLDRRTGVFTPTGDAILNAGDANDQLATGDLTIRTLDGDTPPGGRLRVEQPLGGIGTLHLVAAATLDVSADVTAGGGLVLDGMGSGEVSGTISGAGGLVKDGPGTVRLTAGNDYTGATTLVRGELAVDGAQPFSDVELDGGVLTGDGAVGDVTQESRSGSAIAPGGEGPAILSTGSLALSPATGVWLQLDGAPAGDGPDSHDQLAVTGTVALGGAGLDLSLGFAAPVGMPLTIVENDGADPVDGTFDDWPEGEARWVGDRLLQISYAGGDGNDVTLAAIRAPSEVQLDQSEPWTNVGAPLTLSAVVTVVTPAPFPTGTVTFASDGVPIGTAPVDVFARAELTTMALAPGVHALTARYGGDELTDPSRSLATIHEVRTVVTPPPPRPPLERRDGGGPRDPGPRGDDGPGDTTTTSPRVTRRGKPRVVRHGRTLVVTTGLALTCPRGDRVCTAAVSLTSRTRAGRRVTIGRGSARVRPGRTAPLTLRTDRRSAPRLARGERERVTVTVRARTGESAPVTTRRDVLLQMKKRTRAR